ncbi:hypothetical protein Nepgr_025093 [Nepenthes gracilis]|uniref:WRKY domain-containing protein n=1 Tax=Nepenthes gracilis TaxID=150966 RepID=A0AAD3Y0R0_NEPGR|nr:hypothetical protein Nepgr_025093 [Nepenthes gracilis]
MAVELMVGYKSDRFADKIEENAVQEAAAAGLQSVDKLIKLLTQRQQQQQQQQQQQHGHEASKGHSLDLDCKAVADVAVNKFRKVISLLDRARTGHARFRRGPLASSPPTQPPLLQQPQPQVQAQQQQQQQPQSGMNMNFEGPILESKSHGSGFSRVYGASQVQRLPPLPHAVHHQQQYGAGIGLPKAGMTIGKIERRDSSTTINFSSSTAKLYMSLTGDTDSVQPSMSSGFQITNLSGVSSAGKPPMSTSSLKRKCSSMDDAKCGGSSGRCHCSKRSRKARVKRVIRVPAISLKMADIPPDDYSWRKYGQKPIKGSPHPRGYYKCSSVRSCPARKHVERALDDPAMLIVTYEGDHSHSHPVPDATAALVLESS